MKDQAKSAYKSYTPVDKPKTAEPEKAKTKYADDKLGSLKTYRRQHGLCFRCGEKWGPKHKCPTQVSIHVVEELLDALDEGADLEMSTMEEAMESEGVMAIGDTPAQVQGKRRTMRLSGSIGGLDILILVDFGSVRSFISTAVADKLKSQIQTCQEAQYITVDGSPLTCSQNIPNLAWSTQGHIPFFSGSASP